MKKSKNTNLVFITGISSGFGEYLAKEFLNKNYIVFGCSRNKPKFLSEYSNLYWESIDLFNSKKLSNFIDFILNKFSKIKLSNFFIINNAAIQGRIGPTHTHNEKSFLECFKINFYTPIFIINNFMPLIKNNKTNIFNVVGGGSSLPMDFFSPYAASKISLARITEQYANEFKYLKINNKCNFFSISPGFQPTKIHEKTLKNKPEKVGNFYEVLKNNINTKTNFTDFFETILFLSKNGKLFNGASINLKFDNVKSLTIIKNKYKNSLTNNFKIRRIDNFNFFEKI